MGRHDADNATERVFGIGRVSALSRRRPKKQPMPAEYGLYCSQQLTGQPKALIAIQYAK